MRVLGIWMNGLRVGRWEISRTGAYSLVYDHSWLASEHARPLSLSLPFTPDLRVTGEVVENFFDNLLPDNTDIRKRIRQRYGLRKPDVFTLLEAIGRDCVGAVQLLPDGVEPDGFDRIQGKQLDEAAISAHLSSLGTSFGNLEANVDFRISIAGAQEKTALLRVGSKWYVPEGATPTTHILKPNIGLVPGTELDFTQSVQNEWLCNQLLKALGLPVANCSIETFGPHTVLCVERFDRAWTPDGWLARLPQEDLCQSLGIASIHKYEADGGPGIAQCLQVLSKSQTSAQDRARFVMTQLAFWLLGAIDGHAKNFSIFMQPGGGYIATPLYDVLSAWPVIGNGHGKIAWQKAKMAMAIPGTKSRHYHLQKIQRRHWKALAESTRIEGLWSAMLQMLARLDTAIEQVNSSLHHSVSPNMAKQIYDGARAQAHRFLAAPD